MLEPIAPFIKTEQQKQVVDLAKQLADSIKETAPEFDRNNQFPHLHFNQLKEKGFQALTTPIKYGGKGISLYEYILAQEVLASGDASTALGIGWHNGVMLELSEGEKWEPSQFETLCHDVVNKGALINRAATEPKTGSPSRGGKFETTAVRTEKGWLLNGKKTFTSLAPALDYIVVAATIEETGAVGGFLIPKGTEGLTIEYTWDTLGMRGTGSEDLIIDNVELPEEALVEGGNKEQKKSGPAGWLLHIPACYLGVALACRQEVIDFAESYTPSSLKEPIKNLYHVKEKIGQIDLELMKAHYILYQVAERFEQNPKERADLGPELAAAKYVGTNAALSVVDLAMRVVGGTSIFRSKPFERYYRDVRAGIHNPPSDDAVLQILGNRSFLRNQK